MNNLEKKFRKLIQRIPSKLLNALVVFFFFLTLFAFFDIETLKEFELWDISALANTVENFGSSFLVVFEKTVVKVIIYVLFALLLILRICKTVLHPKAIVVSHSTFSNAQSTYDESIVAGYSVKNKEINLVNKINSRNIVDAIRTQDRLIKGVLEECDEFTELFYYGIAHIPLIFRAGFQLGDEGHVRLLHKHRNSQSAFRELSSDPDTHSVQLECRLVENNNFSTEMLVVIATSLPVASEDLEIFRGSNICCELRFEMADNSMFSFDAIDSYATMDRLRTGLLKKIRETVISKGIKTIHLVLATSSDFTFFLGQGFSKNHDPEIIAYHYNRNSATKYPWGISNILPPETALVRQSINAPSN